MWGIFFVGHERVVGVGWSVGDGRETGVGWDGTILREEEGEEVTRGKECRLAPDFRAGAESRPYEQNQNEIAGGSPAGGALAST